RRSGSTCCAHGRRYRTRATTSTAVRIAAPPSVIALGRSPGTPYRSRAVVHISGGILTKPSPWVALTASTTQNNHVARAPVREDTEGIAQHVDPPDDLEPRREPRRVTRRV